MSHKASLTLSAVLTTLVCSAPALAAEALNGTQLTALFSGKTVEAFHEQKKTKQTTYFSPEGRLVQANEGGEIQKGTWRVDAAAGSQCIQWEGDKENCSKVMPESNGSYKRLIDGKPVVTISKIVPGNPKNLKP